MGRFDALTRPANNKAVEDNNQQEVNKSRASMEVYQHGSTEAQKPASVEAHTPFINVKEDQAQLLSTLPVQKKPKKLGSWLYEESQRSLAVIAAKRGCKQWEILQEAVDLYLRTTKQ